VTRLESSSGDLRHRRLRFVPDSGSWLPSALVRDVRRKVQDLHPPIAMFHQHFLQVNDLWQLPWSLRWKAWLLARSVGLFYHKQRRTIVSSFYQPPLKPHVRNVTQVGTLLRPEILCARPVVGEHVLVYMRRFLRDKAR
jgi:hypothetical protein